MRAQMIARLSIVYPLIQCGKHISQVASSCRYQDVQKYDRLAENASRRLDAPSSVRISEGSIIGLGLFIKNGRAEIVRCSEIVQFAFESLFEWSREFPVPDVMPFLHLRKQRT